MDPLRDYAVVDPQAIYAPPGSMIGDFTRMTSHPVQDPDVQFTQFLRREHPEDTLTVVPVANVSLVAYAEAGNATCKLDTDNESVLRWRGYIPPVRRGGQGSIGSSVLFARYNYSWADQKFVIYTVGSGYNSRQYILFPPCETENPFSQSTTVDALIVAAAEWENGRVDQYVFVYDGYWQRSRELWNQVQQASWDKVILDPAQKQELQDVANTFFDNREVYEQYGIPWKRGLIFYGPVGNGKTISTKALMHSLYNRDDNKEAIPTLYVKSAPQPYNIRDVFEMARRMAPCLLVFEDIETIVTYDKRSYFFNEVDGLESNDGILMVASTNYLDRLDPGLAKRPSRFDRKYLFPQPNQAERTLYAEFWREKLLRRSSIDFPKKLCPAIGKITYDFSFAYMQEAFVATLLVLAHDETDRSTSISKDKHGKHGKHGKDDDDDDLNEYKLWRVMKDQVKILRKDMDSKTYSGPVTSSAISMESEMKQMSLHGDVNLARRSQHSAPATSAMSRPDYAIVRAHEYTRDGRPAVLSGRAAPVESQRLAQARVNWQRRMQGYPEAPTNVAEGAGVYKDMELAETAFTWGPLR